MWVSVSQSVMCFAWEIHESSGVFVKIKIMVHGAQGGTQVSDSDEFPGEASAARARIIL